MHSPLICSENILNLDSNPEFTKYYNNIMKDLRSNWQSPILYLQKRGYIPKLNYDPLESDNLFLENLGPTVNTKNPFFASDYAKILPVREMDNSTFHPGHATNLTQDSGFFTNLKDKVVNLFTPKKLLNDYKADDSAYAVPIQTGMSSPQIEEDIVEPPSKKSKSKSKSKKLNRFNMQKMKQELVKEIANMQQKDVGLHKDYAPVNAETSSMHHSKNPRINNNLRKRYFYQKKEKLLKN